MSNLRSTMMAIAFTDHTLTCLIDNWSHAGDFLKAQLANCRIGVVDPVSEENQKFFWERVLEEVIQKLKENGQ